MVGEKSKTHARDLRSGHSRSYFLGMNTRGLAKKSNNLENTGASLSERRCSWDLLDMSRYLNRNSGSYRGISLMS